jgi:voltage-gated potassium channel
LLTALGGGAAFAAAEGEDLSTWDGVWWAVTTMTTVGYGDIYPETTLGRIVAVSVMLVGIGFVAILTAALAQKFVERQLAAAEAEITAEVEEAEADVVDELREVGDRLRRLEARLTCR